MRLIWSMTSVNSGRKAAVGHAAAFAKGAGDLVHVLAEMGLQPGERGERQRPSVRIAAVSAGSV